MNKIILPLIMLLIFASCSKEEEKPECYQITDKKKVRENNIDIYYLTLNDYGLKKVSKTEYDQYKIAQEYCLGLKY